MSFNNKSTGDTKAATIRGADQGTVDLGDNAVHVAASSVKKLDDAVAKNPDEALSVVRNWLQQEP